MCEAANANITVLCNPLPFDLSHTHAFSCKNINIVNNERLFIHTHIYYLRLQVYFVFKNKRRWKISAYFYVFFEYKRMRLFLSVYSILTSAPVNNPHTVHTGPTLQSTHVCHMQYFRLLNPPSPSNPYLIYSGNQRRGTLSFTRMQFLYFCKPRKIGQVNNCTISNQKDWLKWNREGKKPKSPFQTGLIRLTSSILWVHPMVYDNM